MNVDFEKKQALVTVEPAAYDKSKFIAALNKAGFGGSVKAVKPARSVPGEGTELTTSPPEPGLMGEESEPGRVTDTTEPGVYRLTIEASAQVCAVGACLPGKATMQLPVTVASADVPSKATNSELFRGFEQARSP